MLKFLPTCCIITLTNYFPVKSEKNVISIIAEEDFPPCQITNIGTNTTVKSITITDFINNILTLDPLTVYKDFENPTIEKFTVQKKTDTLDKILNVLTFCIYANDSLIFKVYTKDIEFDSDINHATVQCVALSAPKKITVEGGGVFSIEIPVSDAVFEGVFLQVFRITKDFFKSHFFNETDNSIILICYLLLTLLQFFIGVFRDFFNQLYLFLSEIDANFMGILLAIIPVLCSFLLFLLKKAVKHIKIKNQENEPSIIRKPVSQYVGVLKNTDLMKQYTLDELMKPQAQAAEKRLPVYISERYSGCSISTTEKHSLIELLQQCGLIIERTGHLNTMELLIEKRFKDTTSALKSIFLVGPSGAGKTVFLHMLEKKLQNYTTIYYSFSHNQSTYEFINKLHSISQASNRKTVLLMDQFEMCLSSQNFEHSFWENHISGQYPDIVFVFACPVSDLGNSLLRLHTDKSEIIIHYLSIDKEELDGLVNRSCSTDADILKSILEKTKYQVESNAYPLAALQMVGNLMEEEAISPLDNRFVTLESELKNSPEKIASLYFEQWLDLFEYPQFGVSILYLLSDGNPYTRDDIQNIALLGSEKFSDPQDMLTNTIRSNKFIELTDSNQFHIIHDYLAYLTLQFCKNSPYLTENMRTSIDYYRDEIKNNTEAKSKIRKRNIRYIGKDGRTRVNFSSTLLGLLLALTLVGPSIVAYVCGSDCDSSLNYQFAAIAFCCCFSTYYIYNICKYFFRIYKFLYIIVAIPGIVSMFCCFLFPNYWAVAIGGELVWLGICMEVVASSLKRKAQLVFQKKFASFVSIGVSIILLGFAYVFLRENLPDGFISFIDWIFYGMFIVFVFISITAHINVSFMFEQLGLTLMTREK